MRPTYFFGFLLNSEDFVIKFCKKDPKKITVFADRTELGLWADVARSPCYLDEQQAPRVRVLAYGDAATDGADLVGAPRTSVARRSLPRMHCRGTLRYPTAEC
jgi:hypothetical protein